MKTWVVCVLLIAAAVIATGCESPPPAATAAPPAEQVQVAPTATLYPTYTPYPTYTTQPTSTPAPTMTPIPPTATPNPTDTPYPTFTPEPSPTPEPTQEPTATAASAKVEQAPAFAPRRGKVLLTSNRVSWDDIFVMSEDGTDIEQLTTVGKCYDAHFFPDASAIVYEHEFDIWKMNADGSDPVNLTDTYDKIEAWPAVAPDGSKIVFLFGWPGGFEIYTMNLDGSEQTPVTARNADFMPVWSPNSEKIAFVSLRSGSANIWMVNRDGSEVQQVTKFGGERIATSPVFSPDGTQIAFSTITSGTAWEVWVVSLDGSDPQQVVGIVGKDPNNSTVVGAWRGNKLLIGGYDGDWDPYWVDMTTRTLEHVDTGSLDDKPSDWWAP